MRIFLTLVIFVLISGCKTAEKKHPLVLSTIPPYTFFVEKIAGDTLQVETLVPPGANPHIYEPTLSQVEKAGRAKVWFRVGELIEDKVFTVLTERHPDLLVVQMTQGIHLLAIDEDTHELDHGHCAGHLHAEDRHIWLSPRLAQKQAVTIAMALARIFPDNANLYNSRLKDFMKELEQLDKEISAILAPLKGQAILVSHPAFGYFCKDYQLVQLSVECEGKEPLPNHVVDILNQAKQYNIKSVLTQPQYNNKGAELIAQELKVPVHMVDPYSSDYLNNMRAIAKIIAEQ